MMNISACVRQEATYRVSDDNGDDVGFYFSRTVYEPEFKVTWHVREWDNETVEFQAAGDAIGYLVELSKRIIKIYLD